jgi:hypothetical protein
MRGGALYRTAGAVYFETARLRGISSAASLRWKVGRRRDLAIPSKIFARGYSFLFFGDPPHRPESSHFRAALLIPQHRTHDLSGLTPVDFSYAVT